MPPTLLRSSTDIRLYYKGHFDGVIKRYREIHVSSWGVDQPEPPLVSVLDRLHGLHPSGSATQTHVLHLASDGEILPHIDNTEASGSWIMGVSLGDERILRVAPDEKYTATEPFEIALPSGSVYLQKSVKPTLLRDHDTDLMSLEILCDIVASILFCLLQTETKMGRILND